MKKNSIRIVSFLVGLILSFVMFYVWLPPINLKSPDGVVFLAVVAGILILPQIYFMAAEKAKKYLKIIAGSITVLVLFCVVVFPFFSSKIFNAGRYARQLEFINSDFLKDFESSMDTKLPTVDRDTAVRLGSRKLGEVVELVSQFKPDDSRYTQVNLAEVPYRVTPLMYEGFWKWLANRKQGIPYYIKINMVNQQADLVQLNKGIKYSPTEYFGRDIARVARFARPTYIFARPNFEIDEEGKPFWIFPYIEHEIFFGGPDIKGILVIDAISGAVNEYSITEIPKWIDNAYSSNLIREQIDNHGMLRNGFWNSVIAQKGVLKSTNGYSYIAMEDDVWLYTGITSATSDNSIVGFVLTNMRTKEVRHYTVHGAEEQSAMESAQGEVQEKGYIATFPILTRIQDRPTYFLSLKDASGLIKMYAFVDVENYQVVGIGDSVQNALNNYIKKIDPNSETTVPSDGVETITILEGEKYILNIVDQDGNTIAQIPIG